MISLAEQIARELAMDSAHIPAIASTIQAVIKKRNADFPFIYAGGGYFRDNRVPKGEVAPIVHGKEVLSTFTESVTESEKL